MCKTFIVHIVLVLFQLFLRSTNLNYVSIHCDVNWEDGCGTAAPLQTVTILWLIDFDSMRLNSMRYEKWPRLHDRLNSALFISVDRRVEWEIRKNVSVNYYSFWFRIRIFVNENKHPQTITTGGQEVELVCVVAGNDDDDNDTHHSIRQFRQFAPIECNTTSYTDCWAKWCWTWCSCETTMMPMLRNRRRRRWHGERLMCELFTETPHPHCADFRITANKRGKNEMERNEVKTAQLFVIREFGSFDVF